MSFAFVTLKLYWVNNAYPSYGAIFMIELTGGILTDNVTVPTDGIKYLISWA